MKPAIVVSAQDAERLEVIADHLPASASECRNALLEELGRADILDTNEVPATVVTMNSLLRFEIQPPGDAFCMRLVYPADLQKEENAISILTPIGTALLGLAEGDEIAWPRPDGQIVNVRILEVLSQPQRAAPAQH